jgi:hypothetical protein
LHLAKLSNGSVQTGLENGNLVVLLLTKALKIVAGTVELD